MNTIRKKIIRLSLFIWIIMAGVWLGLSIYNQKTVEAYNTILQRYLSMNEISQFSQNSITLVNRFMDERSDPQLNAYIEVRERLKKTASQLRSLKNKNNLVIIINYSNMIDSQIEAMNLAVTDVKADDRKSGQEHFEEANSISKFISETTLSLLSEDLKTYNSFYQAMIERSRNLQRMGIWMLVLASCILLLLSFRFADGITRPILALSLAAKKIALGNYEDPLVIETNDEISFLAKTFNQMRLNVQQAIIEVQHNAQLENDLREHKLLLKETELRSLQSQINPHFLFNTLNLLSKKAYLEGAEETSDLISSVSGLFRYNLKQMDRPVQLGEELKVLDEYLTIQKARFMGRVTYHNEIDPACLHILVPNLTLQPFVENAFIHAVEPSLKGGTIIIRVFKENESVVVEIIDDGAGMNEERIQAIYNGREQTEQRGHSTGIGIGNVIQRLRLFYGTNDILHIESSEGFGTCIRLRFPETGGNRDDSNHHR